MLTEGKLKERFGRRVKTLRTAVNLTQSGLAERSGISEEYLSKLERGLASPSFSVLASLAATLRVRPRDLFLFAEDTADAGSTLAEAESILATLFETLPFGVFLTTESGRFRLVSPSMARLLGYKNPEHLLAEVRDIARDLYINPAERRAVLDGLADNGGTAVFTTRFRCQDGAALGVRLHVRRVPGESSYLMGIAESLTGRPCGQQGWLDWLYPVGLRELHHRIKNNFAMLKSILDLEAARPEMSHCRDHLDAVGHKLLAAARLHDRLYAAEQADVVDVGAYLAEVLEPLRDGFSTPLGVSLRLECQPCTLEWSRALRLGLLVVELATNALKHAYPATAAHSVREDSAPAILVTFRRNGQEFELLVADHGTGFGDAGGESGLALVRGLAESLGGTMAVDDRAGSSVSIRFPADPC